MIAADALQHRAELIPLRELVAQLTGHLAEAGVEGPRTDAWLLLGAATGRSRADLIAGHVDHLSAREMKRLEALTRRRLAREPMAYIIGEKEFWSLPLWVTPAVLIPRPDSETVVEAALAEVADPGAPLRVLDLGTGSGCLLLALLSELANATGVGVDANAAALTVAQRNAERLGLAPRAHFMQDDWGRSLDDRFDLIVSNPPYVPEDEFEELAPEIRKFEPRDALAAGPDGLVAYAALAGHCARLLMPRGRVVLEIGRGQAEAVASILERHELEVIGSRADLSGVERCLIAIRREDARH